MQQSMDDKKIRDTIEHWERNAPTPSFNKEKVWQDIEEKQSRNKVKSIVVPQWVYTIAASIIFFILGQGLTIFRHQPDTFVEKTEKTAALIHGADIEVDSLHVIIKHQQEQLAFLKLKPSEPTIKEIVPDSIREKLSQQSIELSSAQTQVTDLSKQIESYQLLDRTNIALRDSINILNQTIATVTVEREELMAQTSKKSQQYILDINEQGLKETDLYTMGTSDEKNQKQSIRISFIGATKEESKNKTKTGLFKRL